MHQCGGNNLNFDGRKSAKLYCTVSRPGVSCPWRESTNPARHRRAENVPGHGQGDTDLAAARNPAVLSELPGAERVD